jgi:hypothetical protein
MQFGRELPLNHWLSEGFAKGMIIKIIEKLEK